MEPPRLKKGTCQIDATRAVGAFLYNNVYLIVVVGTAGVTSSAHGFFATSSIVRLETRCTTYRLRNILTGSAVRCRTGCLAFTLLIGIVWVRQHTINRGVL